MAEAIGWTASRLGPGGVGHGWRQGYGLRRGGRIHGLRVLIGDDGDALARKQLFLFLKGILDA
jgi:hypothetical protein